jgi:hypothetical protein
MMETLRAWQSTLHSATESFSAARLLYTFILLAIILIFLTLAWAAGREVISTWGRGKIYLAEFSFFSDGEKKPQHGEQIRNESILYYRYIRGLIKSAKQSHDAFTRNEEDQSGTPDIAPPPNLVFDKQGALPDIDLSIQGVNVKALLSYFVKLVSPENPEVSATIFKTDTSRRLYVSLPDQRSDQEDEIHAIASPYIIETADKDSDTAFRLACFLIWSQSSTDRDASYEEFCDWARLLRFKSALDPKDPDTLDLSTIKPDIDFLTDKFERAANGKIQYKNILSTLYGMEKYVGKQSITIGSTVRATINSVVDIVRYYGITGRTEGLTENWSSMLSTPVSDPVTVDQAFFADQFSADCKEEKSAHPNVVRIVFEYLNSAKKAVPVVMSGLLLRDETVLTYLPPFYPIRDQAGIPMGAKVQTIACGKITGEFEVAGIKPLGTAKNDTFLLLTVRGLKPAQPAPQLDFEMTEEDVGYVTIVGFVRNTHSAFVRPALTAIDNSERYVAPGKEFKRCEKSAASAKVCCSTRSFRLA